jgi:hypothetical protein
MLLGVSTQDILGDLPIRNLTKIFRKSSMCCESLFHCVGLDELALHFSHLPQSNVTDAALEAITILKSLVHDDSSLENSQSHACIGCAESQPRQKEPSREILGIQKDGNDQQSDWDPSCLSLINL